MEIRRVNMKITAEDSKQEFGGMTKTEGGKSNETNRCRPNHFTSVLSVETPLPHPPYLYECPEKLLIELVIILALFYGRFLSNLNKIKLVHQFIFTYALIESFGEHGM